MGEAILLPRKHYRTGNEKLNPKMKRYIPDIFKTMESFWRKMPCSSLTVNAVECVSRLCVAWNNAYVLFDTRVVLDFQVRRRKEATLKPSIRRSCSKD